MEQEQAQEIEAKRTIMKQIIDAIKALIASIKAIFTGKKGQYQGQGQGQGQSRQGQGQQKQQRKEASIHKAESKTEAKSEAKSEAKAEAKAESNVIKEAISKAPSFIQNIEKYVSQRDKNPNSGKDSETLKAEKAAALSKLENRISGEKVGKFSTSEAFYIVDAVSEYKNNSQAKDVEKPVEKAVEKAVEQSQNQSHSQSQEEDPTLLPDGTRLKILANVVAEHFKQESNEEPKKAKTPPASDGEQTLKMWFAGETSTKKISEQNRKFGEQGRNGFANMFPAQDLNQSQSHNMSHGGR